VTFPPAGNRILSSFAYGHKEVTAFVYDNVRDDESGGWHLHYPGLPSSWVQCFSKEEAAALRASDRAVIVTYRQRRFLIPQYRALCLADFTRFVDKFRAFETLEGGVLCFFRGQTRDYFDEIGSLGCLPAGYRAAKWLKRYHGFGQVQLDKELKVWDKILVGEFGVNAGSQLGFEQKAKGFGRFYADTSPSARVWTNIMLLSILQHYGFPTPSLDVTADPLVALWFALHTCLESRGKFRYETVRPLVGPRRKGPPQTQSDVPSVLIFLQHPGLSAVNVLTSVEALRGVAERPFRQQAVSLPFASKSVSPVELPVYPWERERIGSLPSPRQLVRTTDTPTHRIPAAMIKIYFSEEELRTARSELTAEYLFPTDEPLYTRLLSSKAPHLAVYV
jgi:FRG domain